MSRLQILEEQMNTNNFYWPKGIWSLHIEVQNDSNSQQKIEYGRILNNGSKEIRVAKGFLIKPNDHFRFVISKNEPDEIGVCINFEEGLDIRVFKLLDRAHFPTDAIMYYRGSKIDETTHNNHIK